MVQEVAKAFEGLSGRPMEQRWRSNSHKMRLRVRPTALRVTRTRLCPRVGPAVWKGGWQVSVGT